MKTTTAKRLSRSEQAAALADAAYELRYVYGKRWRALQRLGITDIRSLLGHYPFRYNDFSDITRIVDASVGQQVAICGRIEALNERRTAKGGSLLEADVFDGSGVVRAVWFNQLWLSERFKVGEQVLLLGKLDYYNGYKTLSSPLYSLVNAEDELSAGSTSHGTGGERANGSAERMLAQGISGVYHASGSLTSNWIRRLVSEALRRIPAAPDPLPVALRIKRKLISRQSAWRQIHFPQNQNALKQARFRLAYEEIFLLQLSLGRRNLALATQGEAFAHDIGGSRLAALRAALPFQLTASQERAVADILQDMAAERRMNRMLLGDVGSGKTIVAGHALAAAADSGWQAAMMAPTEVLAQQFASGLGPLLSQAGVRWGLLTSSTTARERAKLLRELSAGSLDVLFGTHALLEDDVSFRRLALVIIDEQQRFGVRHRELLVAKGPGCDFLNMTATPIPRSLALVLYGDAQTSYLDSRPMPAQITTRVIRGSDKAQVYSALRAAVAAGEQGYIVCPTIGPDRPSGKNRRASSRSQKYSPAAAPNNEEEEAQEPLIDSLFDFDDAGHVAAAQEELEYLQSQVFCDQRLALLTSRLPAEQKKQVMEDFRRWEIDILVSTTVIEVGVDVPNATVMLIEDADRFGLAQLHQLRGRVGRGQANAQVFLSTSSQNPGSLQRLRFLENTNDGFELAEADLRIRREGDIAGIRQHGKGRLSLINVIRDAEMIACAQADAQALLAADPQLQASEHQHLRYELDILYPPNDAEEDPASAGGPQGSREPGTSRAAREKS